MLSAIEQIGPVTGPSAAAAALPYAYHHNTYAIVAAAAAAAAPPITSAQEFEELRAHKLFSQQQQQQQQQHQHHLGFLATAPTIANLTLLSPPLSSPSSSISNKSVQHVELSNFSQSYMKHQTETSPPLSVQALSLHHSQEAPKTIMSANEFTRPRQSSSTISIHPLPLQQHNLGLGLKNGYCSPTAFAVQHCGSYASSDQSAPINLVTTSSAFPSSPYQLRRSPSSCSSVDVENDDSMSPVTIQTQLQTQPPQQQQSHTRKPADHIALHKLSFEQVNAVESNNQTAVSSVASTSYPVDYTNLYASRAAVAALYGAPIFPTHHNTMSAAASHVAAMHSHASYLNAMPAQPPTAQPNNSNTFSVAYLKAIQNAAVAAAGMFSPTPPQSLPQSAGMPSEPPPAMRSNVRPPTGSILALAPPSGSTLVAHPSNSSPATQNDLRYKSHADTKKAQDNYVLLAPISTVGSNKLPSGTYLNDKVSTAPADTAAENFFKVPSGKEGSLKHRILTRPASADKTADLCKPTVMRTHNSTSNFRRGSYIELSNGVFRKVEDMRTEDFIKCAERSLQHQLIESTVVKIGTTPSTVLITFSYNRNRSRADIEVTAEHPFFVYGQGWASCQPETSLKAYGLKCQRLQVGDICISLSKREASNTSSSSDAERRLTSPGGYANRENQASAAAKATPTASASASRNPRSESTIVTTMASSHMSVPMTTLVATTQYHNLHNMQMHLLPPPPLMTHHHNVYAEMADMLSAGAPMSSQRLIGTNSGASQPPLHLARPTSMHRSPVYFESVLPPQQLLRKEAQQIRTASTGTASTKSDAGDAQDEPVDASLGSMSRKRRWSAPESICDNDCMEHLEADATQPLSLSTGAANHCRTFIKTAKRQNASN